MTEVKNDPNLIAYCGLYCGACGSFIKGKCLGCQKNEKATWCQIRVCCQNNKYRSCADCKLVGKASDCKKFNNLFSKIFALLFRSDRQACVNLIKELGYDKYAQKMATEKKQSIKR